MASLYLDRNGVLGLKLNGHTVVTINPATGRLLLVENLKPSEVPGIALDIRGAIQLCWDDADFYKRS